MKSLPTKSRHIISGKYLLVQGPKETTLYARGDNNSLEKLRAFENDNEKELHYKFEGDKLIYRHVLKERNFGSTMKVYEYDIKTDIIYNRSFSNDLGFTLVPTKTKNDRYILGNSTLDLLNDKIFIDVMTAKLGDDIPQTLYRLTIDFSNGMVEFGKAFFYSPDTDRLIVAIQNYKKCLILCFDNVSDKMQYDEPSARFEIDKSSYSFLGKIHSVRTDKKLRHLAIASDRIVCFYKRDEVNPKKFIKLEKHLKANYPLAGLATFASLKTIPDPHNLEQELLVVTRHCSGCIIMDMAGKNFNNIFSKKSIYDIKCDHETYQYTISTEDGLEPCQFYIQSDTRERHNHLLEGKYYNEEESEKYETKIMFNGGRCSLFAKPLLLKAHKASEETTENQIKPTD